MGNNVTGAGESIGILSGLAALLKRGRLGELLVLKGQLSPAQLRKALAVQRTENARLGDILVQQHLISRSILYKTLLQQWTLRCVAAAVGIIISCASFGSREAYANALKIKDIPPQVHLVSTANNVFVPISHYPALFGSEERSSANLKPFTKWTSMFERFDRAMNTSKGQKTIKKWKNDLEAYTNLPLYSMAQKVNDMINEHPYIIDEKNWNKSDYWETPVEFFTRGGDCEDFAIAKYASLRALGVPEDRLRIAILHDEIKNIPHAVLIVYTDRGALMLDNQIKEVRSTDNVTHYRPIFSINRQAWWLHTRPQSTIIASAR